jgi:hypothetical protein
MEEYNTKVGCRPAPEALPPAQAEVARCVSGRATAWSERAVPPALEPGRMLLSGQYRLHYILPLEPMGGGEMLPPD